MFSRVFYAFRLGKCCLFFSLSYKKDVTTLTNDDFDDSGKRMDDDYDVDKDKDEGNSSSNSNKNSNNEKVYELGEANPDKNINEIIGTYLFLVSFFLPFSSFSFLLLLFGLFHCLLPSCFWFVRFCLFSFKLQSEQTFILS